MQPSVCYLQLFAHNVAVNLPISAKMAVSLRAITTSNPVSAENKPVSAIERLNVRILKTGHLRFTGRNTG
jgi:hypothetical protein